MRLRYTQPALDDLDSILAYITDHSPAGAQRVQRRIQAAIDLLSRQPHMGVRTEDPTIRRLTALPYPYLVFYEVTKDELVIHAIKHSSRDDPDP